MGRGKGKTEERKKRKNERYNEEWEQRLSKVEGGKKTLWNESEKS